MAYDDSNIFAKILRGEIPSDTVYEDNWALAFKDISPRAPVHVLVIPKGAYENMEAFTRDASDAEIAGFFRAITKVAELTEVTTGGYRLIANNGADGNQEVPHLHYHVLGGRNLGSMLKRFDD